MCDTDTHASNAYPPLALSSEHQKQRTLKVLVRNARDQVGGVAPVETVERELGDMAVAAPAGLEFQGRRIGPVHVLVYDEHWLRRSTSTGSVLPSAREGVARAERELTLHPENPRPAYLGAVGLTVLGELDRAKEWAARALAIDPDDVLAQYNVACFCSLVGEHDRAIELLLGLLPRAGRQTKEWVKHGKTHCLGHRLVRPHRQPCHLSRTSAGEARNGKA